MSLLQTQIRELGWKGYGNWLTVDLHVLTSQGVLWTDWEDTFIGPIEWDLACLVAAPYVLGTDWEKAEAALKGYGDAIDFEILENCMNQDWPP